MSGSVASVNSIVITVACTGLLVSACGGDSGTMSPSGGGSAPFEQTINGTVAVFDITEHQFTTTRSGNLTATVTWANSAIDLDLYLTASNCNNYPPVACTILERSDAATGTSETVRRSVSPGTQLKFWVDNFSETLGTSYILQIRID